MRSSNSSGVLLFYFNYFIFPIIFFREGYLFNYSLQLDPFIRAVPSLFPLSLVLFVVSCNDEDGTTSDTICRPGCLPERPSDDNRHDLIPLLTLIALHTSFLDEPERSPPTSTQAASYSLQITLNRSCRSRYLVSSPSLSPILPSPRRDRGHFCRDRPPANLRVGSSCIQPTTLLVSFLPLSYHSPGALIASLSTSSSLSLSYSFSPFSPPHVCTTEISPFALSQQRP
jgi:hypothetical protein